MAVRMPAARMQIDFHVPTPRGFVPQLHERIPKIRAAFQAHETWVQDAHGQAVQSGELIPQQTLVLPHGLQQAFGRRILAVAQERDGPASDAELGVKAGRNAGHLALLLLPETATVKLVMIMSLPHFGMENSTRHSNAAAVERGRLSVLALVPALAFLLSCPTKASEDDTDLRRDSTVRAIEKVMPSVVNIATETIVEHHDFYEELFRQFYGTPLRREKAYSLGSGVIIDQDGYLLTNWHVISRANRIQVKLWDGREYEAEALVETEGSDVALLKIKAPPNQKFTAIKFAQDDDLLLGETVLALGNPFGLGGSVTKGILSSKNRRLATGKEPLNEQDWLETDAAINPGNSGGPLVNLRGELIGLNVAVAREAQGMGMGFSIPIKQVSVALSHFFTPELTDSLWFGARLRAGTGPLQVLEVNPGSPASKAGLCAGDELVQVDGQQVRGLIDANRLLCGLTNHEGRLVVKRSGESKSLSPLRLGSLEELVRQRLGCSLLVPTPPRAQRMGIQPGDGLLIDDVEKDGPADRAQLQRDYLLTNIDGQPARELRDVAQVLSEKKKGDPVQLALFVRQRLGLSHVQYLKGTVEVTVR